MVREQLQKDILMFVLSWVGFFCCCCFLVFFFIFIPCHVAIWYVNSHVGFSCHAQSPFTRAEPLGGCCLHAGSLFHPTWVWTVSLGVGPQGKTSTHRELAAEPCPLSLLRWLSPRGLCCGGCGMERWRPGLRSTVNGFYCPTSFCSRT